MHWIDYGVILAYFLIVIGIGFLYRKRAAQDLEAYFLGGKRIHWLALAMSGSVSNFDITGTMWIVSMLFLMGMRSMWIHWMWGWMMSAFFMTFIAAWVRRSNVMTGAEWMVTRFGKTGGGLAARMAAALAAAITVIGMIGYAFQGIGKFAHVYFPQLPPSTLAFLIIGITTFYVLLGGLYSVVVTDVIQTVVVVLSSIVIAWIAHQQLTPELIEQTLPGDWASLMPLWRIESFAGTENANYEFFGLLVMVWVCKGLLLNAGGPGAAHEFQRFLAAANPRDAAKAGAVWPLFLIVRWGMAMGIVLLALVALNDVQDPEEVMPIILQRYLPMGLKGLVIAGLLAAFMSTFSSTVNSGASYLIRDFWQPFFRPQANEHDLVKASYLATVLTVGAGILIGLQAKSIAQIWEWLMTALTAGVIVPNVLRWYWWRMNGWGYAAGVLAGMLLACVPLFLHQALPMFLVFPPVVLVSTLASILVTFLTAPVHQDLIDAFYCQVRPFGLWGPVRRRVALPPEKRENPWRISLNVLLAMAANHGAWLAPMYWVGHWHQAALLCLGLFLSSAFLLYFTWYRYLPED